MKRRYQGLARLALSMPAVVLPVAVDGAATLGDALRHGRPILDVRYRHEHVEEDAFPRSADAHTVRTRLGYETQPYRGFHALLEIEAVTHLGPARFNDTVEGPTAFPVVADPEDVELDQGYLAFAGIPDSVLRFGRQRLVLDNQRFVGAVGFRQNEQTFDALAASNRSLPDTTLQYVYVFEVQRIFGDDSPVGEFGSDSHLLHAEYEGFRSGRLSAYAYRLDLEADVLSSQTYGVRFAGGTRLRYNRDVELLYALEVAQQSDYAGNPRDFSLGYVLIEPGIRFHEATARLGYEVLGGDGTSGFQTPLATLHAFNGITDQFLATPPDGLADLYLKVLYEWEAPGPLDSLELSAAYHRFWSEDRDDYLGSEWSVKVAAQVATRFHVSLEHAEFEASGFKTDKEITWVTLQYRY